MRNEEKLIKGYLLNYFEEKGYYYFHQYENTYFRKDDGKLSYRLEIQSNSNGIGYIEHSITYWQIEDILIEIGKPNFTSEKLLAYREFMRTLINRKIGSFAPFNTSKPAKSEIDCILYSEYVKSYMEIEGKTFNDHYSFLPNALSEMDNLEKEGKYWHQGDVELVNSFFTGLIISKLCNDVNFDKKIELVNSIYYPKEHNLQQVIPYYEKLKERLKTVEPIYNI